ncbi:MAG: TonB-dependent receptor plug domain-containing protein [Opitutaceae bacterium]|nr:TonB-dependent receptor plug domain-containing protein [Opitutaceae bacterium]
MHSDPLPTFIRAQRLALTVSLALAAGSASFAQTVPAAEKETIKLPEFTVNESAGNPYVSRQALSASRVAMSIQDIPQSVTVVTSEFMQDSMSLRMLDAAKYLTPVVESTLPIGGDRYMIRGFQVSHEFIDGAEISGQDGYSASFMPYNIERVEIIKGPNAILVPGGSPGGQFNPITKSPIGKDHTHLTLELAQYIGNAVSFDVNRVLSKGDSSIAARFVGAYWDSTGYANDQFRKGYMFAPSISWQLSAAHKLIVKAEFMQNRESTITGLPVDPTIGSTGYAQIARGLPRDFAFGDADNDFRHRATERVTFELLSSLGDHISSRLQLMANHVVREDAGGTGAAIAGISVTRNPNTGQYEPGVVWSLDQSGATAIATSTSVPVPAPSAWVFSRTNGAVDLFYSEAHFRNDYAAKFDTQLFKSTTIAGIAANVSKVQFKSYPAVTRPSVPANNLGSITFPPYNYQQPTPTNGGGNRFGKQEDMQVFVYENLSLLDDRVLVSGGVSRFFGDLVRTDTNGIPPAITFPSYDLSTTAKTFGLVGKPVKGVSVFYGYNTTGGTMPSSLNPGTYGPAFRAASGTQSEYGVKLALLDERLTASFAYFDIEQQNYPVPNSDYYTLIALGRIDEANALPNPLYLNLNSKGWEFESTFAVTKNLMLIGNYTSFKIRQPITDVRVRAVPDKSGAIYADYRFTEGKLRGFGASIGVDYKSDVVGENATGYTTTKPLPGGKFVANQPTFLVAGRTLVNLGFSYRAKDWTARVQLNNAADKDYILAAGSRTSAVPGDPRNVKASITYKF